MLIVGFLLYLVALDYGRCLALPHEPIRQGSDRPTRDASRVRKVPDSLKCQMRIRLREHQKGRANSPLKVPVSVNPTTPAKGRTYSVSGTGNYPKRFKSASLSLQRRISINGTELPPDRSPYRALIHSDGSLTNSYMDIAW